MGREEVEEDIEARDSEYSRNDTGRAGQNKRRERLIATDPSTAC